MKNNEKKMLFAYLTISDTCIIFEIKLFSLIVCNGFGSHVARRVTLVIGHGLCVMGQ